MEVVLAAGLGRGGGCCLFWVFFHKRLIGGSCSVPRWPRGPIASWVVPEIAWPVGLGN